MQNGKNYTVFATGLLSNGTLGALPVNDQFVTTGLNDRLTAVPEQFELLQNYPNPFNPETKISYVLPNQSRVKLTVYDILGKEIARLVDGVQPQGSYDVLWNGRDANGMPAKTGVYFYRLEAENFKQTRKMTLIK
ncbi:T9SS type A sorting domain-containing protein [bacterium]|nr:T9SS type A sorting domain-containing protein [bacterium]